VEAAGVRRRVRSEHGVALLVALLATTLMAALGSALVLNTTSDTMIAAYFRAAHAAQAAADGALTLAAAELSRAGDWSAVLAGGRSRFVDGLPGGHRELPGVRLNLSDVVSVANCGRRSACTEAEVDDVTAERPWGANNPRWTLYLYMPLRQLSPSLEEACCYVVALVADDPSETDANPRVDGSGFSNPGAGILQVRAEAFGVHGAHAVAVATVSRRSGRLRVVSWRDSSF
jgi:hypothetical protein